MPLGHADERQRRPGSAARRATIRAAGEGLVFLTTSVAGEDSEESKDLGGSGLLGAAEGDGEGHALTSTAAGEHAEDSNDLGGSGCSAPSKVTARVTR
jgi:hypothetical protein